MAKNKTTENSNDVTQYINGIADEKRRKDCLAIIDLMEKQTGLQAKMWGTAIVGFGSYHYTYDSGHSGDAPLAGFASRTNAIALYLWLEPGQREELLAKFGKHKSAKSCVYIQKIEDIDLKILGKMVDASLQNLRIRYPS